MTETTSDALTASDVPQLFGDAVTATMPVSGMLELTGIWKDKKETKDISPLIVLLVEMGKATRTYSKEINAKYIDMWYLQERGGWIRDLANTWLDYCKAWSSIWMFSSIRSLPAIVVHFGLQLHYVDVDTAFFDREINKRDSMGLPKLWLELMEGLLLINWLEPWADGNRVLEHGRQKMNGLSKFCGLSVVQESHGLISSEKCGICNSPWSLCRWPILTVNDICLVSWMASMFSEGQRGKTWLKRGRAYACKFLHSAQNVVWDAIKVSLSPLSIIILRCEKVVWGTCKREIVRSWKVCWAGTM